MKRLITIAALGLAALGADVLADGQPTPPANAPVPATTAATLNQNAARSMGGGAGAQQKPQTAAGLNKAEGANDLHKSEGANDHHN